MNGKPWATLAGIEEPKQPGLGSSILGTCLSSAAAAASAKGSSQAASSSAGKRKTGSDHTGSSSASKHRKNSSDSTGGTHQDTDSSSSVPDTGDGDGEGQDAVVQDGPGIPEPDHSDPPPETGDPGSKQPNKRGANGKSKSLTIKQKLDLLKKLEEIKNSGEYKAPEKARIWRTT